jgi:signal transduction histidine kinase
VIAVRVEQRDQYVCILISDQGIGIRESARERIFQPYYRSLDGARAAEGIGIGLSIVQEIVILHGGTVELIRTGSEGSTFLVSLPRPIPDLVDHSPPAA